MSTASPSAPDWSVSNLRIPPHSIEAEQSILGGLLLDNVALERISDILRDSAFYRHDHRLIYQHICKLIEQNKPADVVTVYESLQNAGLADDVGGIAYINSLAHATPTAANIRRYAEIVADRGVLRRLITTADDISTTALNPQGRDTKSILDEAEAKIFKIGEETSRSQTGLVPLQPIVAQVVERIDELYHREDGGDITGVPTGFIDLDVRTAGLQRGDLIIVAGRPSMGKTTFSMNIAEHVAVEVGLPVAVFSMEMPGTQLAMRMMGSIGRIDANRLRTGKLVEEDWPRLTYAIGKMQHAPMFIDETGGLTAMELRSRARRLCRQVGDLGAIVIDYIQLMSGRNEGSGENRTSEISEISRSLKGLAKELNVPVIALSQLNRSLEQRPNKRPVMSDLRESGAIEQDADIILFVYRDEVYNPDSPDKGSAEIIIAKQRNGPIGTVRLAFIGEHTKFANFAAGL
jgi:replicative DNA helicase